MLRDSRLVGFIATSNFDASRTFYNQLLGLTLVEETPYAIVFESMNIIIRIQKVEQVYSPPYTSLGWEVQNILKVVRGLSDSGVQFERFEQLEQDDLGIWSVPDGSKVAWFRDPDGNRLSLTQHARHSQ